MLADCADPCIRGRISKLLASAVAAANFMFMLNLLLTTGFGDQLISTREVAIMESENRHVRTAGKQRLENGADSRLTASWRCGRSTPKKSPDIEPGLEWRKRNSRTSRSRLALSDLVSHPFCLRELMGTTNSSHPLCPSLNPLKAATSFAQQRHLKCRRCPTAERSLI